MAIVHNRSVVDEVIEAKGHRGAEEPRIVKIVEGSSPTGAIVWGLVNEAQPLDKYDHRNDIYDARTIWEAHDE